MTTVIIDETTSKGKELLKQLAQYPAIAQIQTTDIEFDENGHPLNCVSWEILEKELIADMSEHYGIDFAK